EYGPVDNRLSSDTTRCCCHRSCIGASRDLMSADFHWSDSVPSALQIAGLAIFASALALIFWAMRTNRFFSSVIRLQEDRGHELVTDGPYRWVRHPGYIAGFGFCLSSGIALGSWLSLVPAVACVPLLLRRTVAEDRFLKSNLKGYSAYADAVRYRWVPGIW